MNYLQCEWKRPSVDWTINKYIRETAQTFTFKSTKKMEREVVNEILVTAKVGHRDLVPKFWFHPNHWDILVSVPLIDSLMQQTADSTSSWRCWSFTSWQFSFLNNIYITAELGFTKWAVLSVCITLSTINERAFYDRNITFTQQPN